MEEHTHHGHSPKASSRTAKITLVLLALIVLFLFFLLWRQYVLFQKAQGIQALRGQITRQIGQIATLRSHGPLTAADASYIQAWMTFDYIDTAFNIPPTYLESALAIHNVQYPHISIAHYARENGLTAAALVTETAGAVRAYIASSSAAR